MLYDPLMRWENEGGALKAGLELDQHQAGDADPACELGVVEVDSAEPLRAEQHAQAEERDQQRQAEPLCGHRCDDGEQQHSACQQDPLIGHARLGPPRRRFRRPCGGHGWIRPRLIA
jgi:hypothetical protein